MERQFSHDTETVFDVVRVIVHNNLALEQDFVPFVDIRLDIPALHEPSEYLILPFDLPSALIILLPDPRLDAMMNLTDCTEKIELGFR